MEFIQKIIAAILAFFTAIASFFGISVSPKEPKAEEKSVTNVILLIGDGMGPLHLEKTKHDEGAELVMDTMPQQGFAMTYSATDEVTDSAAAGTALACGVKTYNHAIGYYWFEDPENTHAEGSHPMNITELCMQNGMKTGIVTSDYTSGATPAAFSAHTSSRNNTDDIYAQQLASGIDLIWGKSEDYFTASQVEEAGYTYVDSIESMNAVGADEKSFGQFTASVYHTYNKNEATPTLSQMTESAVNILSQSDGGFFLMVEGAHIDKKSHDENESGMTEALCEFDNAVARALDFAEKDGHTLVVVTADHETGGIVLNDDGSYSFTQGSHSAADVPVRAYGPYDFIENGSVINNIEIPQRIAKALEFEEGSFPCEVAPQ